MFFQNQEIQNVWRACAVVCGRPFESGTCFRADTGVESGECRILMDMRRICFILEVALSDI